MTLLRTLGGFAILTCVATASTLAQDVSVSTTLTAAPTTQPDADASPSTQPSPAAAELLAKVNAAYAKLQSAQLDGQLTGRFDVDGKQDNQDASFTSTFHAPNRFRHEVSGDVLMGSTGEKVYIYKPKQNAYLSSDAPKDRGELTDWPKTVAEILQEQNPSLLLALTKSAADNLKDIAPDMDRLADTDLAGKKYPTLQFELPGDHQVVTLLVDPQTWLLRQAKFDMRKYMEMRGALNVKSAVITVDYTNAVADGPMDDAKFAWTPPVGATLASANAPAQPVDDNSAAAQALVGKAAPDFTLPGLDDKTVKLSSLKGSVVVVDLWATWCGPCVASLPHLDQLYKEQSPNGLKVLAVNLQEDKDTVKTFVQDKKWVLPVLLDSNGDVAKQYGADAIPETVIIGKDGVVKKVFVGAGDDTEAQIKEIVAKEMSAP
jgi:thiol-disulfide isomerase/thioredoxin/outer membrane lipoprotein-sorting protein